MPWFNVLTNKPETANIPAQKIMVTGDAANNALALPPTTPAATPTKVEIAQPMPQVSLYMLLGGAFVLGIILCFALMRLLSRASKKPNPRAAENTSPRSLIRKIGVPYRRSEAATIDSGNR